MWVLDRVIVVVGGVEGAFVLPVCRLLLFLGSWERFRSGQPLAAGMARSRSSAAVIWPAQGHR